MIEWLKDWRRMWCDWTHGGGRIKRDINDQINWQFSKCGRWSIAVNQEIEKKIIDRAIRARGNT